MKSAASKKLISQIERGQISQGLSDLRKSDKLTDRQKINAALYASLGLSEKALDDLYAWLRRDGFEGLE